MKWTPLLIDWETSDRTQMDYAQDIIGPVNIEAVSTGEADPSMDAEIESPERLMMFGKLISSAHKECMEIETDLKIVPEYTNFERYLSYEYKASTPGTHCYCNRCIGFLEMAHFNVIKTRNILYSKLVTLAKNNIRFRERYSTLYYKLTGFSVKFSNMTLDLPIIDNSCYDYQRRSPLVLGICNFRRRYEQLEACHVEIVQAKNTLRKQINAMTIMNEDLLDKCDQLFAIMQEKLSANSETFDKHYQYDPKDSCPCHHNCSDCREMIQGQIETLYRERSELETWKEEYTELEDKYLDLVLQTSSPERFHISTGRPNDDPREDYAEYLYLRSEAEEYEGAQPYQIKNLPRGRCGSCSYCALELKLIHDAEVYHDFRKTFDFRREYSDLLEEYSNFRNRLIRDW
ncbi:hypothetical protein EAE96_001651 [Botrytis aclada]|nr:hypothetical protein EAE96_001651 [Botrytis aclada]